MSGWADGAGELAEADMVDLDRELAAGHAAHRLTAVISCAAGDPAALEHGCRRIVEAASLAGLDLRPLHGQHDLGLAAALPLCRTRPGGRW